MTIGLSIYLVGRASPLDLEVVGNDDEVASTLHAVLMNDLSAITVQTADGTHHVVPTRRIERVEVRA